MSINECNGNFSSAIPRNAAESLVGNSNGNPQKFAQRANFKRVANKRFRGVARNDVRGAELPAFYGKMLFVDKSNELVDAAISKSIDLDETKKLKLKDTARMTGNDYDRLSPKIQRVVSLLRRLNIRSVLRTDTDF